MSHHKKTSDLDQVIAGYDRSLDRKGMPIVFTASRLSASLTIDSEWPYCHIDYGDGFPRVLITV